MGLSGRGEPRGVWIRVGFAESGQIVEPQEVFGWEGALSHNSSQPCLEQGWPHGWTRQLRDVSR